VSSSCLWGFLSTACQGDEGNQSISSCSTADFGGAVSRGLAVQVQALFVCASFLLDYMEVFLGPRFRVLGWVPCDSCGSRVAHPYPRASRIVALLFSTKEYKLYLLFCSCFPYAIVLRLRDGEKIFF
jgi:hypothetical protein